MICLISKKKFTVALVLSVLVSFILGLVAFSVYTESKDGSTKGEKVFFGTYEIDENKSLDTVEYLAVIPPEESNGKGQFIIYNSDDDIIYEGVCKTYKNNYAELYTNDSVFAVITFKNNQYFFSQSGNKVQNLKRIADSPMVP